MGTILLQDIHSVKNKPFSCHMATVVMMMASLDDDDERKGRMGATWRTGDFVIAKEAREER